MQIHVDRLRKQYGDFELAIADFTIPAGQALGLVGNNGAGKTTLLRLVLDLIRADEGAVQIGGHDVAQTFDWKRSTGSHLDDAFLIDFLTPDEFWAFVGSTYGLSEDAVQRASRTPTSSPTSPSARRRSTSATSRRATGRRWASSRPCWPSRPSSCSTSRSPASTRARNSG